MTIRKKEKAKGWLLNKASRDSIPVSLTKAEIGEYVNRFNSLDGGKKGFISINDIRKSLQAQGEAASHQQIDDVINEIDSNHNGQVEVEEYLQMMSAIKSGAVSHSRFAKLHL